MLCVTTSVLLQFLHKFSKHSEPCLSARDPLFLLLLQTLPTNDFNTSNGCGNEQTAHGCATATNPGLRSTPPGG